MIDLPDEFGPTPPIKKGGAMRDFLCSSKRLGGIIGLSIVNTHSRNWSKGDRARSVKKYYIDVERYDWVSVTGHFKGVESLFHRNRMRVILDLTQKYGEGSPIIDVGCGTGLIPRNLPPLVVGLDINPWAIERARTHAPNADLIIADAENIPFKDSSASTVVCTEVIEHVPSPESALEEIRRLLKPGGNLIGSVPHGTFLWKFRVLSSTCPHSEPFHNLYGLKEIKGLLEAFETVYMKRSTLRLNIVFVSKKKENITQISKA